MTPQPLHDYVLLKEVEEEKQIGELILAENTEATKRATVIAIGDTVSKVKVDNLVLFERQATTDAVIGGETYLLIKETNIFCII